MSCLANHCHLIIKRKVCFFCLCSKYICLPLKWQSLWAGVTKLCSAACSEPTMVKAGASESRSTFLTRGKSGSTHLPCWPMVSPQLSATWTEAPGHLLNLMGTGGRKSQYAETQEPGSKVCLRPRTGPNQPGPVTRETRPAFPCRGWRAH